jgi:mono/diheme cytochrome c family protein
MGEEGRLPPTLDGVGDKLRRDFLDEVLEKGGVDRRATMHTLMPRWHGDVAKPLATLLADDPKTAVDIPAIAGHAEAEIVDKGRDLVGSKGLGCIKCHAFAGDRGQGLGAIDMTRFPKRLRHEWYLGYVKDPQRFRPGTRMPAAWPEGKVFYPDVLSGDAGNQIEAVWRYVSLAKPRPPVGLGNDPIELVATDKPVIYRNFIEGAGPRAIGIGFPERVNIAWDAEVFRVALVWKGSFIDARRHWSGRGEGFQPPMGDAVFTPDAGPCVAILGAPDAPWPTEPVRKRGGRFGGYALDKEGRPTFRWGGDGGSLSVTEAFAGDSVGNPLLKRTVTVTARGPLDGATFRAARGDSIEAEADGWWRVDRFWRVRVTGDGAGKPVRLEIDGKQELRVPLVPGARVSTATILEELSW